MIMPKLPKSTRAIPTRVRELVSRRSEGVCEGCGVRTASEIHHRKYLSRGGRHNPSNLLHLCGWGNHTGCHGKAHTDEGAKLGWSVTGSADESKVVVMYRNIPVKLQDDGSVVRNYEKF